MNIEPNDTIVNASDTGVSSSGQRAVILSGEIDIESDIDIYKVRLNQGDTISIDIDAQEFGSTLDSALRVFDADGNQLGISNNNAAPTEAFSLDPYLTFMPDTSGEYFIGVSNYSFDYDPINGGTETENLYLTTGDYDLEIAIFNTIDGTEESDNLTGTEAADWIDGKNGYDTISGGAGGDYIFGGAYNDMLRGDGGADYILGGADNDLLRGEDGDDYLIGGDGYDRIFGGSGNDTLKGEAESDMLYGDDGADIFVLDFSADTILDFEDGIDRFYLTSGLSFSDLSFSDMGFMSIKISAFDEPIAYLMNVTGDFTETDFVDSWEM